jgi:hypothetical protein
MCSLHADTLTHLISGSGARDADLFWGNLESEKTTQIFDIPPPNVILYKYLKKDRK